MDPVINSVLQSPLARNLNHIATDSTQFTYHVEQNAPPLSLKKGYIDSSQSFVGFDNTYTFTLPQWGYLAKNILRLQYQIKPLQRTHVTPVLPMYHMIDKVELMSHNNVIETLYGDSIMIKHAYYSESCCAATKMMGTLNIPVECGNYIDISNLFRDSTDGTPFNPFDSAQWNNQTNVRTVTLFLELPFSFTDNPAMYFDTRFVEYLTVQVKLSSTKHGLPLFQAACAVEVDMGEDNIQLDPTRHKNDITDSTTSGDLAYKNYSDYYEDKVSAKQNPEASGTGKSSTKVGGACSKFYYRPYYTRCIGTGGSGGDMTDGTFLEKPSTTSLDNTNSYSVHARVPSAFTGESANAGITNRGKGLDPFELQLGGRPGSRLPSKAPLWMKGYYPSAAKSGAYACAHAGEPRFLRVGACNFNPAHYTVGYWGFLAASKVEADKAFGENPNGISSTGQTLSYGSGSGSNAIYGTNPSGQSGSDMQQLSLITAVTTVGAGYYIKTPGTGYAVGDTFTLSANVGSVTGEIAAVLRVTAVSSSGAISTVEVANRGSYYTTTVPSTYTVTHAGGQATLDFDALTMETIDTGTHARLTDERILKNATTWAAHGGKFVYDKLEMYGTKMAQDILSEDAAIQSGLLPGVASTARLGDGWNQTTNKYLVHINTRVALI